MARFVHHINAFNGGELSPHVYGRYDLEQWQNGAETLLNFIIQPEGGIKKRSGTRFVKALQDSSVTARLIPFMYSTTFPYILEFGASYIKFYRNEGAVLESSQAITTMTQANPVKITKVGHGYVTGDEVFIDDGGDMIEVNNRYFSVTKLDNDNFTLDNEDGTGHTAYTTGGTVARVYKVATTYTQSEVEDIKYAQSSDTLYLAHPAHAPAQLTRSGHTTWTLADVSFVDGPYLTENQIDNKFDNSATTGSITIDADVVTNINNGVGFVANDVGRFVRIRHDSGGGIYNYGHAVVTARNSALQVNADVINRFASSPAGGVQFWRIGAFYLTNYPGAVSFGDGRLWWGGTPDYPSQVYGSYSGDFLNYAPSTWKDDVVQDASAVSYSIGVNQVNEIKWIANGKALMLGTPGGVFPLTASSNSEPITPTNVNVPSPSFVRAASIVPAVVGDTVVFITRAQNQLRAMTYSISADGYQAEDLTRLADHIGDSAFQHVAYAQDPDSVVWCVRADGSLGTLTYRPEEGVIAWSRQILGGVFGGGDPVVEKIAVVEAPDATHDQVWLLVKRTVNGSTVRYVEFLEQEFSPTDAIEDSYFVDCGLTYDGASATTIYGLTHLEGETVQVLADGAPVADCVVSGGKITLGTAASVVHAGYSYNSDLYTLRADPSIQGASSTQGMLGRIDNIILRFYRTVGGKYGPDSSTLSPIVFRDPFDPMDTAVPFFSGDVKLTMELGRDRKRQVYIRQDQPLPFNLLSMVQLGNAGDR